MPSTQSSLEGKNLHTYVEHMGRASGVRPFSGGEQCGPTPACPLPLLLVLWQCPGCIQCLVSLEESLHRTHGSGPLALDTATSLLFAVTFDDLKTPPQLSCIPSLFPVSAIACSSLGRCRPISWVMPLFFCSNFSPALGLSLRRALPGTEVKPAQSMALRVSLLGCPQECCALEICGYHVLCLQLVCPAPW